MSMKCLIFKGSCPECGVYQTHKDDRCGMAGCLVLHYYDDVKCKCGEVLWYGNMPKSE